MSSRRYRSTGGFSLSFFLVLTGGGFLLLGVFVLLLVVYLYTSVNSLLGGSQPQFARLVFEPLISFYYSGFLALGTGAGLMIVSSVFLIRSMGRTNVP